ncbi:MAG: tRNA preQ1(34) S-adenosylmethionine ribosyltransferase-isomerase QueA [Gammaproteobacteria bacterium RIFCSPHIGHO2_12_FULL_35_23]|nr:MAG: tRNA preQ1(34) S-adenosylmethionine ribosyltransferase-isomerase QueA [Gammaproteobacteria bacterium RIFCSPHIGHO2_12_FULL_35_23]
MQLAAFDYKLPPELIARYPTAKRSESRLLCLSRQTGQLAHKKFYELIDLLSPQDLLVFNNSRVIRARLFGHKPSGGRVEILVERVLSTYEVIAHVRVNKKLHSGSVILLPKGITATLLSRSLDLFHLQFSQPVFSTLEQIGHIPLPGYINRADEAFDENRYQTVYADLQGSVAAPTAGLHFDQELLNKIKTKGVAAAFVTLHVGAGTFQPVRVENITQHAMHAELIEVSAEVCEKVKQTQASGGRIIAVGTTSVRCLETASQSGIIKPFQGETNIFIYPGHQFQVVDVMITNFHLPKSSLLMLVSAFAGLESIKRAYQVAIENQYRFYSYGDAMFIVD